MAKNQSLVESIAAELEPMIRRIAREEAAATMAARAEAANGDGPAVMAIDEAAKWSRLGMSSLRTAIREGRLKTIQSGRRRLIRREDLDAFLGESR
jgi:excisionase family DNA binding protein